VLVFCQRIRIEAETPADAEAREREGEAVGEDALSALATGTLPLSAPTTGACKLIDPAAGTAIALGALEDERGAVGDDSVQERSPTAETSAKNTVSRGYARINACRIGRSPSY